MAINATNTNLDIDQSNAYVLLVGQMKNAGWTVTPDGSVEHDGLGMLFDSFTDAIIACINVASEV